MTSSNPYKNPFIPERADPYIVEADGCYYFTASYPAYGDALHGYDRIVLRKASTVAGLADAQEVTVWTAHSEGIMARHIWAPELHFIGGKWYIFFAAANSDDVWHIRPYLLECEGSDPINDPWKERGRMLACEDDGVSFNSFSLDMTYFEHKGRHFLIWAEIIGDSSLFMAEIDPADPRQLISKPILLTKPEYDWEKIRFRVNEGAFIVKNDKKIILFFSASGTGSEYCIGMLSADIDADVTDITSWTKHPSPILRTEDLKGEAGPGHNSVVTDEKGRLLLVYHARPEEHSHKKCGTYNEESLYDPCRHARIRLMSFDAQGFPVIDKS